MQTTFQTVIDGFGKHAAIEIPESNLAEIGGNKRAPLKVTINGYTYQSTATGVVGICMVVFPTKDRLASGAAAGDTVDITLELDEGYRQVEMPAELVDALKANGLSDVFHDLNYSTRKEYARLITEAKSEDTRNRRLEKIIGELKAM